MSTGNEGNVYIVIKSLVQWKNFGKLFVIIECTWNKQETGEQQNIGMKGNIVDNIYSYIHENEWSCMFKLQ